MAAAIAIGAMAGAALQAIQLGGGHTRAGGLGEWDARQLGRQRKGGAAQPLQFFSRCAIPRVLGQSQLKFGGPSIPAYLRRRFGKQRFGLDRLLAQGGCNRRLSQGRIPHVIEWHLGKPPFRLCVKTNRDGVGARVTVVAGQLVQIDEVHSGRGYQSHWGSRLHFGLGTHERVDRIEVRWIGGGVDVFERVPARQLLTITEGSGK